MKKEVNYLSLPDYSNKYLVANFNQKFNLKNDIFVKFKLSNLLHLGSALKAVYLLEIIFPRKASVIKLILRKKKLYFGQKSKDSIFFTFNLTLSSIEFIEFFRFFSKKPLNLAKTNIDNIMIINKKLKQFEFNNKFFIDSNNLCSSFFFFKLYHLN